MSDPKPFASLSSGLLARKGAARPAMRPQGFGQVGSGVEDDLGWNDMGFEPPKAAPAPRDASHDAFGDDVENHSRVHPTGLTPVTSPVHSQQAELADRLGADEEDEEFDETAELYDPNAVDADASEDEEADAVEAELPEVSAPRLPKRQALEAPIEPEQPFELQRAAEDEPFELTERLEDFDPFEPAAEEEAFDSPLRAPAYEPPYSPVSVRQPALRAAPGSKPKAAFTLRLDPDRHFKLRLACAVNGRSAQQIVTDAVDQLLREMPELDAMAEKAKRKG